MGEMELSSHDSLGISSTMEESLKAETEFHVRLFERIIDDCQEEEVCFGTWIPVWAAAFEEVVHMYELPPVQPNQSEEATQFPSTVFDMLDDTRKREQAAEQESAGCLQLRRGAALPADQEWYVVRFQRARRGVVDKAAGRPADDDLPLEQQNGPDSPRVREMMKQVTRERGGEEAVAPSARTRQHANVTQQTAVITTPLK